MIARSQVSIYLVHDRTDEAVLPPVHTLRYRQAIHALKRVIAEVKRLLQLQAVQLLVDFLTCL